MENINKIKQSGLVPIIFSNNSKKRVSRYAKTLDVGYVYRTLKPFPFAIKKFIKTENIPITSVIIVGDQVFTDIFCANNAKVKSILTERLTKKDQIVTILNRLIDKMYRKKIQRNNLSIDWENEPIDTIARPTSGGPARRITRSPCPMP